MHDPVMRPAESEGLEHLVGIADKVPIGEEQEFDDVPTKFAGATRGGGFRRILVSWKP